MMAWHLSRIAAAAGLCLVAAACASAPPSSLQDQGGALDGVRVELPTQPLECVPYARVRSGIAIYGDAWTWWDQAAGHYPRTHAPAVGAVLVFSRDGGPPGGHVAVVRAVTTEREIRVDHANWLGRDRVFLNDPVRDVSAANDWSRVRVWNPDTKGWGIHDYPITGFILPGPARVALETPGS